MNRFVSSLSAALVCLACGASHAQESAPLATHCKEGEYAYLNAKMSELRYPRYRTEEERRSNPVWMLRPTGKFLSLCADRPAEPFMSMAYRFGASGKVEFERVADKSSPFHVFERGETPHSGDAIFFFTVDQYTYCISEATGQGSGISLTVLRAGKEVVSYFSGNSRGTDYETGLFEIWFGPSRSPALKAYEPANPFRTPCDGQRVRRP